ncbi:MAG TPA: gliding motility-associated protein GldE [Algoriphagus sp.]|jgi:putative hemolysin|uniref:Protein involved in gliding motility GldE n=1 Tax=Algoriphagus ornithinivorans TaxID=226506 RepID=A0A1I5E746_9BACT|nr:MULTISPECIES: gliding motility-associated protein GldE [Algoriphagus]MAL14800.1 gliding motility-associated protein GldE [Algoriphagus sp.]SFO07133.1 protein involved in gliding motility GldE [Algoriphagus ornithinivorans]HAH38033.1 gliding motility-associated protein GldE [Algoriphagus sp.]HAS57125.1 gliding motility-associated protein GldE [Algoriphagus sp.]HAZ23879.1 gliding motility-associated protein GldE [Algoriphagus sp.]
MDDPYPSWYLLTQITQPSVGYLLFNGLLFILLLLGSALVSGSEVAFFSLSNEDLESIADEETKNGKHVARLLRSPKQLLSTILILNNLINIAIVTLTTFVSWSIFGMNATGIVVIMIQTIGVTFAIVFFGEIVPKVYANKAKIEFSLIMAPTINFFSTILKPISLFLMAISNLIERKIEKKGYSLSVDELNQALEITTEDAPNEEKDILRGIVNFGTLSVKQVMRSRMEITAVDTEMDFHELMDKINKSGYSRIPVYHETIDNIEGILYIKDLLPYIERDENFAWKELIRKSFFVPENKRVDTLLKDFQQKRVHMAIVVDEYGGTSGLVTLEDLIEEIIGEINDEFDDKDDMFFQEIDSSTFIFEGKISLNDFCKKLDLDSQIFDDVKGESESLGGLLLELNNKLPKNGTKIHFEYFEFTILAVDARRIKKVKVHLKDQHQDGSHPFTD